MYWPTTQFKIQSPKHINNRQAKNCLSKTLKKDLLFIEEGAANKLKLNNRLIQIQQIKSMVDREETKQFIYKFYW